MRAGVLGLVLCAAALTTAAPASAVLDQPAKVSRSFAVQTVFGPCYIGASTEAGPALPGVGRVGTAEYVDCSAHAGTSVSLILRSSITGTTAVEPVNGAAAAERFCFSAKSCSLLHSRGLLAPGDYTSRQRLQIDLVSGTGWQTYFTSYPSECAVDRVSTDILRCEFTQTVTWMPKAP